MVGTIIASLLTFGFGLFCRFYFVKSWPRTNADYCSIVLLLLWAFALILLKTEGPTGEKPGVVIGCLLYVIYIINRRVKLMRANQAAAEIEN